LAYGYQLKTGFQTLLAQRDRTAFDRWLQEAEPSDLPSFQSTARSFRQDYAAIIAALTLVLTRNSSAHFLRRRLAVRYLSPALW
jgi:transposase